MKLLGAERAVFLHEDGEHGFAGFGDAEVVGAQLLDGLGEGGVRRGVIVGHGKRLRITNDGMQRGCRMGNGCRWLRFSLAKHRRFRIPARHE